MRTATFRFARGFQLHRLTPAQSRGLVIRSVKRMFYLTGKKSGVKMKARFSKTQGIWIRSGVVFQDGWFYRGLWKSGDIILNNMADMFSWVGSLDPKDKKPIVSEGLGRILVHEFGHGIGLGHSPDPIDIMFFGVGVKLTTSRPRFKAWFAGQETDVQPHDDCACWKFIKG